MDTKVTFKNCAAQGDLMLRRIDALPGGVKPLAAENGVFVVAHSETGHNHVIDATPNVQWYGTDDPMVSYLQVIEATDATETLLRHLRRHDTHKTIVVPTGIFEVRRQREYTPEGWRRVAD
jgi:gentisate 1,2-dioxygenase